MSLIPDTGTRENGGDRDLRLLAQALNGIGTPWVLTLVGLSGLWLDDFAVVPLLWFAPPFLLTRLWIAARLPTVPARHLWWSTFVVGLSAWGVAVAASLLGESETVYIAHWAGVSAGATLFCAAMLAVTRSLGWSGRTERWRAALTTALFGSATFVISTVLLLAAEPVGGGSAPAWIFWGYVVGVVSFVSWMVALFRVARSLRATRAGLTDSDAQSRLFSTGVTAT